MAERVAHGGHDVPLRVLRRRFPRSLQRLLDASAPAVDHALCSMNAGASPAPMVFQAGPQGTIADANLKTMLLALA